MGNSPEIWGGGSPLLLGDPGSSSQAVEDYLDRLMAPLVGVLPFADRCALKLETQEHLEIRINQLELEGKPREEATREALKRQGAPEKVAEAYLNSWFEGHGSALSRRFGRANTIAFSRFVLAHFGYALILELLVYFPSGAAYSLPVTPASMRRVLPEPLPIPDQPWAAILLFGYPVLAPLVAGWFAGRSIPTRAVRSVYNALLPLAVYSFVVGMFMLPSTTGLLFALAQVVIWLPLGAGAAYVASCVTRVRNIGGLHAAG